MKNAKNKININRQPISSQEIGSMQNFGSVLKGFEAATLPFYKKWWFVGSAGIAVIATVVVAVTAFNYNTPTIAPKKTQAPVAETSANNTTEPAQEAFIKPAFKGFDIDFTRFWVESGKAKQLAMPGGTVLKIPACHFEDEQGNKILGKVEIRYREMNDPVDFAVSGIPMSYDSAGNSYTFESAGMFELQGWKDGKQVFISSECPITVEQKTVSTNSKFNMYYLDTANRTWQYAGKPNWVSSETEGSKLAITQKSDKLLAFSYPSRDNSAYEKQLLAIDAQIKAISDGLPDKPKMLDPAKQNFYMVFDSSKFENFLPYKATIFGVAENAKFTPALYKYNWANATLDTINLQKGEFKLNLYSGTYSRKTITKTTDSTLQEGGEYDPRRWYVRAWHSVRAFFGGKKYQPKTLNDQWVPNTEKTDYYTYPVAAVTLVPIDSSQYNFYRSDYRNPVSFKVYKVVDSAEYNYALEIYQKTVEKHQAQLAQLRQQQEEIKRTIAVQDSLWRQTWAEKAKRLQQDKYKNLIEQGIDSVYIQDADNKQQSNSEKIVNAFAASKFGIYNCDYPFSFKNPVTSVVNFKTEKGKSHYVSNGYIIVKNKNALMNVSYNNCCNISISHIKKDVNIFFTVLPDDRIAFYTPKEFDRLATAYPTDMVLHFSDKKMENVNEIKAYLGITKNTGLQ